MKKKKKNSELVQLHALARVVRRAIAMHADCCKNSCDQDKHYPECVEENKENDKAKDALLELIALKLLKRNA